MTAEEAVAPEARGLVPSERQGRVATPAPAPAPAPDDAVEGAAAEVEPRAGVREWLKSLDPRTLHGPRGPLVIFAAVGLLTTFDDLSIPLVYPEVQAEFGAQTATLGYVLGAVSVASILLQPLWGWLSDRVRRVLLIRIASIGQNLFAVLTSRTGSFAAFGGSVVTGNTLTSIGQAPSSTILADYYGPADLARVLPVLAAVGQIPLILAPPLAGLLIDRAGWRTALASFGVLATAVSALTFFLREPPRGAPAAPEADSAEEAPPPAFAEAWRALRGITTVRRTWMATPFCYAGVLGIAIQSIFYFTSEFGLTASERGIVLALQGAILVAGSLISAPWLERMVRDRPGRVMTVAGAMMALDAATALFLWLAPNVYLAVAVALPVLLVQGMALPPYGVVFRLLLLSVVPPRIRGVGVTSTAPFVVLGLLLLYIAVPNLVIGPPSPRSLMLTYVPLLLIAAYFLSSAAPAVARDIRTATATSAAEQERRASREAGRAKLLVCRGLELEYAGSQVLFGIDLDVEEGEILALLGTNGAGKSTVLRAIAGIQEVTAGAILLDGVDIAHEPAHANAARGIVMMPGGHAIFPSLTVAENLRAAAWLRREDGDEVERRTDEVYGFFPRLRERRGQLAGTLSGGEQQMVALGQAFLMRPRLLMIDELTLGLAPAVVEQLLDILRRIHAQGTTVVLVEQSVNVALTIAERAVFLEKGEKLFDGPTEELLSRPDIVRSVFMGGAASGKAMTSRRDRPAGAPGGELVVTGVSVSFGGVQALDDVGLSVSPGEIVGVIGPNGAGKTTLFDVISGYVRPESGRVVLGDADLTELGPDARAAVGLGRSFQNVRLFPSMTVRENVMAALDVRANQNPLSAMLWTPGHRRTEARLRRQAEGLVDLLGLRAFADKFVGELSTGSRRAVDVACMLAFGPKILLLDEPTSGLAQAESEDLGPLLERVVRETGCGLLVIEHDVPLVTSISNRLVAMELGRVIATGPSAEVVSSAEVLTSYLAASDDVIGRSGRLHDIAAAVATPDNERK